jgi:hypothetical protein
MPIRWITNSQIAKQRTFLLLNSLLGLLLTGCTSLGSPDKLALGRIDFGPTETIRICVLLDEPSITQTKAEPIISSITQELSQYNIQVEVPWYRSWHRPSGNGFEIIKILAGEQLKAPCDKLLALVGRNFGDFLVGLLAMDEFGSVDTVTNTRGYVAANVGTVNQLLVSPPTAAVHEAYHLLGCQHDTSMTACYARIGRLKKSAAQNRVDGIDFFPTYSRQGQLLTNRADVNIREAMALRVEKAKERDAKETAR